jgi:hypothetical protein
MVRLRGIYEFAGPDTINTKITAVTGNKIDQAKTVGRRSVTQFELLGDRLKLRFDMIGRTGAKVGVTSATLARVSPESWDMNEKRRLAERMVAVGRLYALGCMDCSIESGTTIGRSRFRASMECMEKADPAISASAITDVYVDHLTKAEIEPCHRNLRSMSNEDWVETRTNSTR